MVVSEKRIEQDIMLSVSKQGGAIFKNAVGLVQQRDGSTLRYGLCKGSSDLIGIQPVTITADMVGKTVGVFIAIEVKKDRHGYKATDGQTQFIDMVKKKGGLAGVVYSPEDALQILQFSNGKE